jgi:hypothetical protein
MEGRTTVIGELFTVNDRIAIEAEQYINDRMRMECLGRLPQRIEPHSILRYCTVSVALPFTPFTDAEIVVVPAPKPCARPEALTVATEFVEESHVTCRVMFIEEPSLKLPVAVND